MRPLSHEHKTIRTVSLNPFGKTSCNLSLTNALFHLMMWIHPRQCLSLGCLTPFASRIIIQSLVYPPPPPPPLLGLLQISFISFLAHQGLLEI